MISMQNEDYERILKALGETAVFVMRQDTHEILFCHDVAVKQEGKERCTRLHELWENQWFYCAAEHIKKDGYYSRTFYDDTKKKVLKMTVMDIEWGKEHIPAFAVVIAPILEGEDAAINSDVSQNVDMSLSEGYTHSCIVDLTQNVYVNLLPDCFDSNIFFHGTSYDEMAGYINKRIHPLHDGAMKEIYCREHLLQAYYEGKQRISRDYLFQNEEGIYRWIRGSVLFQKNPESSDVTAVMLWREIGAEKGVAQQLLLEQEALFNSLPGYVLKIAVGEEISFLEASKTFYDFFGETDESYQVGDNVLEEDRTFVVSKIRDKGKQEQPISFECRVRNKKGKLIWVQCEGKIVGHQLGQPVYLLILLDITVVKESQLQLMQERERYRLAVVDMAVGIFEYYVKEDFFVYHNTRRGDQETKRILNFVKNLHKSSIFSAEGARLMEKILRGESTGEEIEIYVEKRKQKEWFFCQGNPIFEDGESGKVKKVVGTLRSIDVVKKEQLRAEEKLQFEQKKNRMSNQRFLQAVNQLYDFILEINLKSKGVYIWKDSKEYAPLVPRDDTLYSFLETGCFDLVHPEYQETAREAFSPAFFLKEYEKGNKELVLEIPVLNGRNVYRWCRIQIQLMEEDTDELCVMVYFKDIDDQKSREEQQQNAIKDALRLAEQANAAKSDFLSRMSHDIRTPMNAIMGMVTIAEVNLEHKEKVADCLYKINSSSKYLLSLINNILDMSKIESGKMPLTIKEFDIHELLHESVVYGYMQGQLKEHEFFVQLKGEIDGIFEGDSLRINQILINLLSNAFKYTPPKGKISLTVAVKNYGQGGILLQMQVRDNGIGIDKNFLEKIFTPFEQGEGGLESGGTGLGLAISQNLARLLGGQIFVESEVGKGTVFRVELPLRRKTENILLSTDKEEAQAQEGEVRNERNPLGQLKNVKVLLAEDNEMNVEIVKTLLEMCGITVDVVRNGQECTEFFCQAKEDTYLAILMDIQMPIMNGYEATKIIRKMKRSDAKSIPIIAMTANAFSTDIAETMAAGMTAHIPKPIDVRTLLNLLKEYEAEKKKIGQER
ncbi:MAG: ATP-binding protein [Anaerotignum sp.]|nr:ATP-binding protein [Anaerotignum sp.]